LPGSRKSKEEVRAILPHLPQTVRLAVVDRHGDRADFMTHDKGADLGLLCECETVTIAEVKDAIKNLMIRTITDLRRRTRVGMGPCQGELCACRAVGLLVSLGVTKTQEGINQLSSFLEERWKGIRALAWGDALRESEYTMWTYQGLCGLREGSEILKAPARDSKEDLEKGSRGGADAV
jgi:glycerol-3-phosphate dehydrogenase